MDEGKGRQTCSDFAQKLSLRETAQTEVTPERNRIFLGVLLDAYVIILYLCAFQLLQFIRILITVKEVKTCHCYCCTKKPPATG